ncbi:MAG: hypothetical protein FJ405_01000 [Verrucomicrobia bacterium]|nr:hypothetical protein [Verrucomicrobiota bacterium]
MVRCWFLVLGSLLVVGCWLLVVGKRRRGGAALTDRLPPTAYSLQPRLCSLLPRGTFYCPYFSGPAWSIRIEKANSYQW